MSQFIIVHQTEVRVGAKLSFIGPADFHSYEEYEGASVPNRSEEVMRFAELYGEMLEKEVAQRRANQTDQERLNDTVGE